MERKTRLCEELEFLQNVFTQDEVAVSYLEGGKQVESITMTIHPATAGNTEEQYVCLSLHITLPAQYPDEPPHIQVRNPRGLSENEVLRLENTLKEYVCDEKGSPVLHQLFELVRDTLNDSNVPHGVCSVCLCDFLDTDRQFLRTECYHYFHITCIAKYRVHWEQKLKQQTAERDVPVYQERDKPELLCPECRKVISLPDDLPVSDKTDLETFKYVASADTQQMQEEWKVVYDKQQSQGGIIDIEKERQKFRLPPPKSPPPQKSDVQCEAEGDQTTSPYTDLARPSPQDLLPNSIAEGGNNGLPVSSADASSPKSSNKHSDVSLPKSNNDESSPKPSCDEHKLDNNRRPQYQRNFHKRYNHGRGYYTKPHEDRGGGSDANKKEHLTSSTQRGHGTGTPRTGDRHRRSDQEGHYGTRQPQAKSEHGHYHDDAHGVYDKTSENATGSSTRGGRRYPRYDSGHNRTDKPEADNSKLDTNSMTHRPYHSNYRGRGGRFHIASKRGTPNSENATDLAPTPVLASRKSTESAGECQSTNGSTAGKSSVDNFKQDTKFMGHRTYHNNRGGKSVSGPPAPSAGEYRSTNQSPLGEKPTVQAEPSGTRVSSTHGAQGHAGGRQLHDVTRANKDSSASQCNDTGTQGPMKTSGDGATRPRSMGYNRRPRGHPCSASAPRSRGYHQDPQRPSSHTTAAKPVIQSERKQI